MSWSPSPKPPAGTFIERSRTFDEGLKQWRIEGSFVVESVVFWVAWDAQIDRGMEPCVAEASLRIENGERDFLVERRAEVGTRWMGRR